MKKILAAILAGAMILSLAGCRADTSWIAKSGETTVPAGVYLYYALNNYFTAMGKVSDSTKAFSPETTIDDLSTSDWIKEESLKNIREQIAIAAKCAEMGIEVPEEDMLSMKNSTASFYQQMGQTILIPNGVSESSVLETTVSQFQRDQLFKAYYDQGGIEEVSQSEIDAYAKTERARVKWIALELKDGEGNLLKSDGKAEMKKMAEEYIRRYNAGEDFDALIEEHEEYYKKLIEEATGEDQTSEFEDEKEDQKNDPYRNEYVIYKGGSVPTEEVSTAIFEKAKIGQPILLEADEVYYVVLRYDVTEREDFMTDNRMNFLYSMKDEEFDAKIAEWAEAIDLKLNEDALKKYKPEKFDMSGLNG